MHYSKYFKPEQKIRLRSVAPEEIAHLDAITAYFREGGTDYFDLRLPYGARGEESYPFVPGMGFEILSEAFGLGVRLTGTFLENRGDDLVRLQINDDFQVFQNRQQLRVDHSLGLRYTKGTGKLFSFRSQWERNVKILQSGQKVAQLSTFPNRQVNLSSSGIRFEVKTPVQIADLCLLLLDLEDEGPPVCALAEVVWIGEEEEAEGRCTAGMQFIKILDSDQKRINKLMNSRLQPQ